MKPRQLAIIFISAVSGVILLVFAGVAVFISQKIMYYPRLTLDAVYADAAQMAVYGLRHEKTPADFNFARFETVTYHAENDTALKGWYIPALKKTNACYIIIHGRSSNRLKGLALLPVLRAAGIDGTHNIFMPDLRNSGESSPAVTAMGHYAADDIYRAVRYLHAAKGTTSFALHGFSMGAMGIAIALDRYADGLKAMAITHVILDSPVADAKKSLDFELTRRMGVPSPVAAAGICALDARIGFNLKRMKFTHTLKNTAMPVLIMTAEDDDKVPPRIAEEEVLNLKKDTIRIALFKTGDHARLHLKEPGRYKAELKSFLAAGK
jgi:pimeloyl-ACP methyl ester carboxylesterase